MTPIRRLYGPKRVMKNNRYVAKSKTYVQRITIRNTKNYAVTCSLFVGRDKVTSLIIKPNNDYHFWGTPWPPGGYVLERGETIRASADKSRALLLLLDGCQI